jgi:hypothetical protein
MQELRLINADVYISVPSRVETRSRPDFPKPEYADNHPALFPKPLPSSTDAHLSFFQAWLCEF